MAKHLLIWEPLPDSATAYILDTDEDAGLIELAKQAMGYYINADENEAVNDLNEFLEGRIPDYDNSHEVITGPFEAVYICGFLA
jgi:hypothetical protein